MLIDKHCCDQAILIPLFRQDRWDKIVCRWLTWSMLDLLAVGFTLGLMLSFKRCAAIFVVAKFTVHYSSLDTLVDLVKLV